MAVSDPGSDTFPASSGHRLLPTDRLHHVRIAYGSALEAESHLELFAAAGTVDGERVRSLLALADRVRALTWRLAHPRW